MKFLCVPCDEPMKLVATNPPDRGSLTIVYRCPNCSHQMAMLTNPYETEVVGSLGVKIGGQSVSGNASASSNTSKCPIAGIAAGAKTVTTSKGDTSQTVSWTPEALDRLQNIPEFVRPMAKQGIESMALERDYAEINEDVLDEAKEFFGM